MNRLARLSAATLLAACANSSSVTTSTTSGAGGHGGVPATTSSTSAGGGGGATGTTSSDTGGATTSSTSSAPCGGGCPSGYSCGTANGLEVCRAPSGIPMFSHVFVILMENTSLATVGAAIAAGTAPNLLEYTAKYASGTAYHGVTHPSLPNYIALTSGDTQGINCDCDADPTEGACPSSALACDALLLVSSCACNRAAPSIADQLEVAQRSWMAFGEDMGTPCNFTSSGSYAVRHVPFLYYDSIRGDAARCASHVVDFGSFSPDGAAAFTFIAPNLVDDMHNPNLPSTDTAVHQNIPNGDAWLGPQVAKIMASPAYTQGGLLVIVWDEDDDSGLDPLHTDDPIPIYVMSPYAKSGGFTSSVKADHYSLLATFEDGLGLSRLGKAASATPLVDYFPAN